MRMTSGEPGVDASGTSLGWVLIIMVGCLLWFTYGVANSDLPIVITNLVSFAVTATLVITTVVSRHSSSQPSL